MRKISGRKEQKGGAPAALGQDAVPLLCALAVAVRRNVMSKDEALLRSELKKIVYSSRFVH